MMKNTIHVHIGQAGIQSGHSVWEQLCQEHSLDSDGKKKQLNQNDNIHSVFDETLDGRYCPRATFIDTQPMAIDQLFTNNPGSNFNSNRNIYSKSSMFAGKESSSSNFIRAGYTQREVQQNGFQMIRKQAQKCDYLEGFFITHSINGGCGSGIGQKTLQTMSVEFPKKQKYNFTIFPSKNMSSIVVEPYNSVLSLSYLLEHSTAVFPFTNQQIYKYLQNNLNISSASYMNVNQIISQAICALTTSIRFPSSQRLGGFSDFVTNSIAYRRIHFFTTTVTSLHEKNTVNSFGNQIQELKPLRMIEDVFDKHKSLVYQGNSNNIYESCSIFMRGSSLHLKSLQRAIEEKKKHINLLHWAPTGMKAYLNEAPCLFQSQSYDRQSQSMIMMANSHSIVNVMNYIAHKYDLMYAKRAFVHWYVGEGLSEGFFQEARQNLAAVQRDYQEAEVIRIEMDDE